MSHQKDILTLKRCHLFPSAYHLLHDLWADEREQSSQEDLQCLLFKILKPMSA